MSIDPIDKKINRENSYNKIENKIVERYEFLSHEIADVFMQVSLTGKILFISPSCERITGFKPEEVQGKRFTLFAPKKEWPKYFKKLKLMVEDKIVTNFETYINKKDGSILPVEFSGFRSKKGRYFNAIMRDISKRKIIDNKYKLLFENSECPITYLDLSGKILLINDPGAFNLNFKKEKLIGKSIYDLLPEFADEQKKRINEIIKFGKGLLKEDIIKLPNGINKWFYSNLQPINNEKNEIIGIQIVSIDISNLKGAEIKLEESEKNFRALAEKSPNMIFINRMGKIVFVNQKCVDTMGYSRREFYSNDFNFMNLISSESVKKIKEALNKHNQGLDISPYEYKIITKNKNKIDVIINTKLIEYNNEKSILGIITDITKQKKIEKEIIETKNYLQNLIDNTSEIIITVDSDFNIKTWNKTAEELIGYKRNDVINKKINKIDLFEFNSEIRNFIENILLKKPDFLDEINVKTSHGNYITLSVSSSIIKDHLDNIKEIIFICKDITLDRKKMEKIIFGKSYLINDVNNKNSLKLFHNLLVNKKGIFIGRNIDNKLLIHESNRDIQIFELSDFGTNFSQFSNLEHLSDSIEKFIVKEERIILFDRLDYLITKFDFESVLTMIYRLNDMIKNYNSILLIRLNYKFLNKYQISILEEEFEKVPSQSVSKIIINDDLLDILKYVNNENIRNINVSYGNIGKMFNISKVTVKKRIDDLIKNELVYSRKIGKNKLLFLTDKGKNVLINI